MKWKFPLLSLQTNNPVTKKVIIIFFLTVTFAVSMEAQKPSIDISVLNRWPTLDQGKISYDGKYCSYVESGTSGVDVLNIVEIASNIRANLPDVHSYFFSGDSRLVYALCGKDSLAIVDLKHHITKYLQGIKSIQVQGGGMEEWVACLSTSPDNKLMVFNGLTGNEFSFSQVTYYTFSRNSKLLLIQHNSGQNDTQNQQVDIMDLISGTITSIWTGASPSLYAFDSSCTKLAFVAKDTSDTTGNYSIFYYRSGSKKALKLNLDFSGLESKHLFVSENERLQFSQNGDRLLFSVKKAARQDHLSDSGYSNVQIWNYHDENLPTEWSSKPALWAVVNIENNHVIQLNKEGEFLVGRNSFERYILAYKKSGLMRFLNGRPDESMYIVSTLDGSRKLIETGNGVFDPIISPDERFVLWYDPEHLNYFTYEISSGEVKNISKAVGVPIYDEDAFQTGNRYARYEVCGWEPMNHSLLIEDKYDIWRVDLQGLKKALNITNSYGRNHKIVFDIINSAPWFPDKVPTLLDGQILLTAYELKSKFNGFWTVNEIAGKDPEKRTMGPYSYFISRTGYLKDVEVADGYKPVRAGSGDRFLVQRMTAVEYPNFFITDNFKTFVPVSDLHPENATNWLRAEIVSWRIDSVRISQGILYKPENFDSTKKYQVIFDYYGRRSDEFNKYIFPEFCFARINIPYFVSNGYLVFVPDIYYEQGHNGKSVLKAVESAARYLSKFAFVDSTKMGLQGHSFGGWETNFLVTHSTLFAAACEASGVSDQVSAYDELNLNGGENRQRFYETFQQGSAYGLGVTPWTRPDLYIENSPVFNVAKCSTPMLMMHGDKDNLVPYSQGLEMYLALRRAGKKAWLLQYKNAGHILNGDDAKDYTIRMKQFFDHYLKGAPPPKWMSIGGTSLELDSSSFKTANLP